MRTLVLQLVNSALTLGFAVLILRASRQGTWASRVCRDSCWLVGIAFAANGISQLVQGTLAVWAFVSGAGSTVYDTFLRFAPATNQSRTGLEIALALLLMLVAVRGGRPLAPWIPLAGLVAGWAAGATIGLSEDTLWGGQHYPMVALLDAIEMVALLGMLLLALSRNSMDRLLWVALFAHAMSQALNAIWFSAIAWRRVPGSWAPRTWTIQAEMAVLGCLMLAIAVHRYRFARRGVHVPTLLEPLMAKRVSSFH